MKNLEFYTEYVQYLEWRLNKGQINSGKLSLLKISESGYNSFVRRLEKDENFNNKIITIIRTENRDKKIDEIIGEDLKNEIIEDDIKIDDLFDEFDI